MDSFTKQNIIRSSIQRNKQHIRTKKNIIKTNESSHPSGIHLWKFEGSPQNGPHPSGFLNVPPGDPRDPKGTLASCCSPDPMHHNWSWSRTDCDKTRRSPRIVPYSESSGESSRVCEFLCLESFGGVGCWWCRWFLVVYVVSDSLVQVFYVDVVFWR